MKSCALLGCTLRAAFRIEQFLRLHQVPHSASRSLSSMLKDTVPGYRGFLCRCDGVLRLACAVDVRTAAEATSRILLFFVGPAFSLWHLASPCRIPTTPQSGL